MCFSQINIFQNTNLYISGLPKHFTNEDICAVFGQLGKIISIRILTCKETGLSRGVCFVRFDTKFEAENAVRRFHGQTLSHGDMLTVKVCYATWQFIILSTNRNLAFYSFIDKILSTNLLSTFTGLLLIENSNYFKCFLRPHQTAPGFSFEVRITTYRGIDAWPEKQNGLCTSN